jgi:predicted ATPase
VGGPRDLPARQQTLRGAIEWSYELLDVDERSVFGLLSLFSTARFEAVEAVAARLESLRHVDVVDQLISLVDKSLVRSVEDAGSRRLSMLQTIREYAAERLEEEPGFSNAARQAHAEHFSEFARAMHTRLAGAGREGALDQLAVETGNLRSAWRHWLAAGDLGELDAMLEPLWVLHDARGGTPRPWSWHRICSRCCRLSRPRGIASSRRSSCPPVSPAGSWRSGATPRRWTRPTAEHSAS